jgi:glutaminase
MLLPRLSLLSSGVYKSNTEGENSQVYPALARVPATLFGICVVGTNGAVQWGERRPKSRAIFAVRPYSRMHTKVV